jgi:hypothetical protein
MTAIADPVGPIKVAASGRTRRVSPIAPIPGEDHFSIAASVKLWTDDFMLSPLLRSG